MGTDAMSNLSALDAADYLIRQAIDDDSGDLLTNLKLQKLLYYAQGCHLAVYGKPLFGEDIEAWDWGPVVPEVYHSFKVCGRHPIDDTYGDDVAIDTRNAEFLNVISEKFGRYSASMLMRLTHQEAPWQESYASGKNVKMDKSKIRDFFAANWVDPDVAVEEDDHDREFAERLLKAKAETVDLPELTADEMLKWLEKV